MRIVLRTSKVALFGAALLSIPVIPASSTEALPAGRPRVQPLRWAPSGRTEARRAVGPKTAHGRFAFMLVPPNPHLMVAACR